jgi:hypothetical protein
MAYVSNVTNATFAYNPSRLDQAGAELACNDIGGHLATYSSLEEQIDVESYYLSNGLLFAGNTPSYWFGARSAVDMWPSFYWLQRSIPGPDSRNYMHWGMGASPEPNNLAKNEYCAACNASIGYQGAWGWSDASCSLPMPYMCRIMDTGSLGTLKYVNWKTNTNYTINVNPMTQKDAEAFCATQGGHIALWTGLAEQQEVEGFFIKQGVLIPAYHQWYWLGIEAAQWPKFTSLDKSIPSPSRLTYQHWADGQPNTNQSCGAASMALSYGNAWGWMDADCSWTGPVICKTLSGWLLRACVSGLEAFALEPSLLRLPAHAHAHPQPPLCLQSRA